MSLSWPQLMAYCELNDTIDQIERANNLWIAAMGAQGDGKAIDKIIKELGAV
jgi:hypothetical protein